MYKKAFTIAFSPSIVRSYQIDFLHVRTTFYVAGMLQEGPQNGLKF